MSVENALKFLALARRKPALRKAVAGFSGRDALDRLVEAGAGHGLDFSAEDYRQAVVLSAHGELDDASLMTLLGEAGLDWEAGGQCGHPH